jgi:YHS domain-containing protein
MVTHGNPLGEEPGTTAKGMAIPEVSMRCQDMAKDVVCNMEVNEESALWRSEHMDKTYYFCKPACKQRFDQNPGRFVKERREAMGGGCCH